MSEWPYIIASYALTWVVLASFVIYLSARGNTARRMLRRGAAAGSRP